MNRLCLTMGLATIAFHAAAEPLFGVIAEDQAEVFLSAPQLFLVDDHPQWSTGGELMQTTLTLQPFDLMDPASGSGTFIDPVTGLQEFITVSMFGHASVSGSISNGAIHEIAAAGGSTGGPCDPVVGRTIGCPYGVEYSGANAIWEDTAYVSGPSDVPIVLSITRHVSGMIVNGGGDVFSAGGSADTFFDVAADSGLFVFGDTRVFTASGPIDFNETQFLTVSAGAVLSITNELQVVNQIFGNVNNISESSTNFGDTAGFTIDVMTPGASLQTASGLSYATPTNTVPEPGTVALLIGAFLMLSIARRREAP